MSSLAYFRKKHLSRYTFAQTLVFLLGFIYGHLLYQLIQPFSGFTRDLTADESQRIFKRRLLSLLHSKSIQLYSLYLCDNNFFILFGKYSTASDIVKMFEVKYCPKIARFREVVKLYNEDSLEELVLQLQTLKLCDDELFISLVCGLIIHFPVLFFL